MFDFIAHNLPTLSIILLALVFDFINGFHDAANATATIVATRVLTPRKAVLWSAFFNFVAVFVFSTGVAKTIGNGLIDLNFVTPSVILAGLGGAILWNLFTWWLALPSSSSHALLGGYGGAAMAHYILLHGWHDITRPMLADGWLKTLLFIFVAPLVGYLLSFAIFSVTRRLVIVLRPKASTKLFKTLQLFSSAMLSLNHGSNDAQKTSGVIASALAVSGMISQQNFEIPFWVLMLSYTTIALGTLMGGWRIAHTMGHRLTKLKSMHGFAAESGAACSIFLATLLKMPISTTLSTTGAVIGVGAARGMRHVAWPLVNKILFTWVLTMPAAALVAGLLLLFFEKIG